MKRRNTPQKMKSTSSSLSKWNLKEGRLIFGILIYILTRYLKRNDEELEKLVKERQRSSHRTKKPREDVLVALKESEANEYASGLG